MKNEKNFKDKHQSEIICEYCGFCIPFWKYIFNILKLCVIIYYHTTFNPLSANPEKWSNTLKQIVGNLPTICLSVFDHFINLALKGLMY